MLLLFLRYGAAESWAFTLGNCQIILNICFITSPNFPKCKCLCMWTAMYHYHISVGQADIHHVCLEHLTHKQRSIVPFHKLAAIPKRLASLAAHKAHVALGGKTSLRLSATSLHVRTEAQIPTLWESCGQAPCGTTLGLWLSPCHPFFLFHLGKKQMMQETEWNADVRMNFSWKAVNISGALNFRKITFKAILAENLQHWHQLTQCAVTTAKFQHPSEETEGIYSSVAVPWNYWSPHDICYH